VTRALVLLAAAILASGCVQARPAVTPAGQQADRRITRGDEGAIRDKVKQCWNVGPQGQRVSKVALRVARVNPDGTVSPGAVTVIDDGGNPQWAVAARRAVLNPACQPWPMPSGGWPVDSFILVFDPKDMF
jgi:hypothetical protein